MNEIDRYRVLIIDDNADIHEDYRKILEKAAKNEELQDAVDAFFGPNVEPLEEQNSSPEIELDSALQGQEGLEKVKTAVAEGRPYALAFIDMRMPPGWNGIKTIEEIWKVAPDTQVVICTAYSDNKWSDYLEKFGRTDQLLILKKPFDKVEVSQLAVALTEKWSLLNQTRRIRTNLEDLVEKRTEQLKHAALHDALTGLANRNLFNDRLNDALKRNRRSETEAAVILLDLDLFKRVNDTLGHPAGDDLLRQVGARLGECVRQSDTVARFGGDEFAIILSEVKDTAIIHKIVSLMHDRLSEPYAVEGTQIECGSSMGIALSPQDGNDAGELIKKADLALYHVKDQGRNSYHFFEAEMDLGLRATRKLEKELAIAISEDQFVLHYQPLVDAKTRRITTFEALVRWQHPTRGLLYPGEFIEVAEQAGLITEIGNWVLEQACVQAKQWPADIAVAINVSAVQFQSEGSLVERVRDALQSTGVEPKRLELEVTETVLLPEFQLTFNTLEQLHKLGVRIVMDDFGSGYSSLRYLRDFHFDKLKLDRAFVKECCSCEEAKIILRTVAGLGKNLGMETTAEGVETEEQLQLVLSEGYSQVQGFFWGRPTPVGELPQLLSKFNGSGTNEYTPVVPVTDLPVTQSASHASN